MAEDTEFFTDRRQSQYWVKKQDVSGLLKQFSRWLRCPLASSPRNLWQMVHSLPKISAVASFWGVEMFKYFIEDSTICPVPSTIVKQGKVVLL